MLGKEGKGAAFAFFKPARVENSRIYGFGYKAGGYGCDILNVVLAAQAPSGRADAAILEMKDLGNTV